MSATDAVRRYYDQNTALFLKFGSSRDVQTIHRALWYAPGISLPQALERSNALVLRALGDFIQSTAHANPRLSDLGCGAGATLIQLLRALPGGCTGEGVTISAVQAGIAARRIAEAGLQDRCTVHCASYLDLPYKQPIDFAYAIESLIHSPDAAKFFAEAARVSSPRARLVIVDDFRSAKPATRDHMALLQAYRKGWLANSFLGVTETLALAKLHGWHIVENDDLTAQLKLRLLPEPLARASYRLAGRVGRIHSMVASTAGSVALQHGLAEGLIEYRMLTFERNGA